MSKQKREWFEIVYFTIIMVVFITLSWANIFSYKNCETMECFNQNLEQCTRAKTIAGNEMIFQYKIERPDNGDCVVDVILIQGELNNQDSLALEGKEMQCKIPIGTVINPESNIGNCHGMLKEGLQDLIINKLHSYIVQNMGKINLETMQLPAK